MTDTIRDAFEAWCRREGFEPTLWIADAPDRGYAHARVMDYWTGWQAATEQGKRQSLSDAQLRAMLDSVIDSADDAFIGFARAVEAAHNVSRVHVMARLEGRIVASSSGLNLGAIK